MNKLRSNRVIRIGIVNLMPEMENTERQWRSFWSTLNYSVELVWINQTARPIRRTSVSHLEQVYRPIDQVATLDLDIVLLTGAPIERFEYEAVDYWTQLQDLFNHCDAAAIPMIHICWGAMAGLFHRHQLQKKLLVEKLTGLYTYSLNGTNIAWAAHLPDTLVAPQSRYAYLDPESVNSTESLTSLYEDDQGDSHILYDSERGHLYVLGHGEYEATTLAEEHERDLKKSLAGPVPQQYYDENGNTPETAYWQSQHVQVIENWLKHHFSERVLKPKKTLKIALLGFGTVGQGFVEVLREWEYRIMQQDLFGIQKVAIESILVRNPEKYAWLAEYYDLAPDVFTTEFQSIVSSKPDLVIEVLTGANPALYYIETLLLNDIPVITANKAALSSRKHNLDSFSLSHPKLHYEAAVGGGIPLIQMVRESLKGVEIESFEGILNGTTNYMLTQLARGTKSYEEALKEAQACGYAEEDATFDVEGYDSAYKLLILAELAFGRPFTLEEVELEGITQLMEIDYLKARAEGGRIKLIASAKKNPEGYELSVKPKLLDMNNPLATTDGVENALRLQVKQIGKLYISGPGAGGKPTGSSILSDVLKFVQ